MKFIKDSLDRLFIKFKYSEKKFIRQKVNFKFVDFVERVLEEVHVTCLNNLFHQTYTFFVTWFTLINLS
jgi:hypothetical protein